VADNRCFTKSVGEHLTMARKSKIHFTLTENALPENMGADAFGEIYIARDTQTVWFVTRSGVVVNLHELLLNSTPVAPPRHGTNGKDGAPGIGERGPAGRDGAPGLHGRNGEHSTVPGPQGMAGRDGRDGKDNIAELTAHTKAVAALAEQVAQFSRERGPQGSQGQRGEQGPQGPPGNDTSLSEVRAELKAARAENAATRADVAGLIEMQKNGAQYLAWLRAKRTNK